MQAGPYEMAWQLMDEHANDPCPNEKNYCRMIMASSCSNGKGATTLRTTAVHLCDDLQCMFTSFHIGPQHRMTCAACNTPKSVMAAYLRCSRAALRSRLVFRVRIEHQRVLDRV
jgi:hypothetical protein